VNRHVGLSFHFINLTFPYNKTGNVDMT